MKVTITNNLDTLITVTSPNILSEISVFPKLEQDLVVTDIYTASILDIPINGKNDPNETIQSTNLPNISMLDCQPGSQISSLTNFHPSNDSTSTSSKYHSPTPFSTTSMASSTSTKTAFNFNKKKNRQTILKLSKILPATSTVYFYFSILLEGVLSGVLELIVRLRKGNGPFKTGRVVYKLRWEGKSSGWIEEKRRNAFEFGGFIAESRFKRGTSDRLDIKIHQDAKDV